MYKYVAFLVALLALFFNSANANALGGHQSVSGISSISGVSSTSGKASKGTHLIAGLEMLNEKLDDLSAKIENIRAGLPEYERKTWKHKKDGVSGTSGTSGVSGSRKHGFGHM
jgi:hypothetical protein